MNADSINARGRAFKERLLWAVLPLLGWEVAGRILALRTNLLPTPSRIVLEMYREAPKLADHALSTLGVFSAGLLASVAVGVPAGIAWAVFRWPGSEMLGRTKAAQAGPFIAFAPLLWVWLQFDTSSKVALAALTALLPMIRGASGGYRSLPGELLDLARLAGSKIRIVFWKLHAPCCLPGLFDGLLSAAPLAMAGAIAAEFVQTDRGLGYLMVSSSFTANVPMLFTSLAVIGAISLAFHTGIRLIERFLVPSSAGATRQQPLRQPGK